MKYFSVAFLALAVALAGITPARGIDKAWETEKVMKTPESIKYDAIRNIVYVSNINGKPTEKDGNGFISRVTVGGEVAELKWITGLDAPKGMDFHGGKLYVSDIDRIVQIDIEKGEISATYPVKGAVFLNDIAVDDSGNVYVSDMSEVSVIYRLREGEVTTWLKDEKVKRPNGLFHKDGTLYVGSGGNRSLMSVDIPSGEISLVAEVGFGIDGLVADGKGGFIVSDWSGKTTHLRADGKPVVLLDTSGDGINSADIDYIVDKRLLIVPTFRDDRVMAYSLGKDTE